MKKNLITVIAVTVLALLLPTLLSAQSASRRRTASFDVTFSSNAPNTSLTINGELKKGILPLTITLEPGTYAVVASAPGYLTSSVNLPISGADPIAINLVPATYPLTVNVTNSKSFSVFLNNAASANVTSLSPGSYAVRVSSPGFQDFQTTVSITNAAQTINVTLQPAVATVSLDLSRLSLAKGTKLQIYVNGKSSGVPFTANGPTAVKVEVAGLTIETTYDFAPGRTYSLSPFAGLDIK